MLGHLQVALSGVCVAFTPSFWLRTGMWVSGITLNGMTLSEGCWDGRAVPIHFPLTTLPITPFQSSLPAHPPELCLPWACPLGLPFQPT